MEKIKQLNKKQPKLKTIKRKSWKLFSEFIRRRDCLRTTGLEDYGKCISCQKIIPRTLLQAGHFIPGRHNANLFYERGCHSQCYNCNINLKGNTLAYMDALIKLYGQGIIEELRANDKQMRQYTIPELEDLREYFKAKIKELKDLIKE